MTTYLGKSCSFCLPRVPFVNCRQFMYLVISLFGFEGRIWDLIVSVPDHQFTDVFRKNEHTQVPLLDRSAPFMNDIAVSKDGVIKLLKGLNPSKALGPDELHP